MAKKADVGLLLRHGVYRFGGGVKHHQFQLYSQPLREPARQIDRDAFGRAGGRIGRGQDGVAGVDGRAQAPRGGEGGDEVGGDGHGVAARERCGDAQL